MFTGTKFVTVMWLSVMTLGVFAFVSLPVCALAQDGETPPSGGFVATGSSTTSTGGSMVSHSGFSATGTGSPSVGHGISASSSNGTVEASMIGLLQQGNVGNGGGMTTITRYSDYVKASGIINNFDVGYHYESQLPAFQTPESWDRIFFSTPPFGNAGQWQPGFTTNSASSMPAAWHDHW